MPMISICLTTCDRSQILEESIKNVLSQSYKNFELIIVDDSTSEQIKNHNELLIKKFTDPRIYFYRNKLNIGLAGSRNRAIELSAGKYFTFKDDDDSWDSEFLKVMMSAHRRTNSKVIVSGYKRSNKEFIFKDMSLSIKEAFLSGFTPPISAQFYDSTLVKAAMGYDARIKSGVDHDLWVNILDYNPHQTVTFLGCALVTPDAYRIENSDKMTLNYEQRVRGIKNSLCLWETKITYNLSEEYYNWLKEEYFRYLCRRFLNHSFKNSDVKLLVRICKNKDLKPHLFSAAHEIIFKRIPKIFAKSDVVIIEPLFRPYKIY